MYYKQVDKTCRKALVTGENIGDSLLTFMVVEIVEGGDSTLAERSVCWSGPRRMWKRCCRHSGTQAQIKQCDNREFESEA